MIPGYYEIYKKKYASQHGRCEVCGTDLLHMYAQLAHRIHNYKGKKRKRNKYHLSDEILNHPLNLALVCSLKCNASVLIDHKPEKKAELLKRIKNDIERNTSVLCQSSMNIQKSNKNRTQGMCVDCRSKK